MVVILALIVSSAAVGAVVAACKRIHPDSTGTNGDGTGARDDSSIAINLDARARAGRRHLAES
jgi:hypothetical protein